jgi:translation initiation factor 2 beta subunit (eIF-2beta)/eIF-5
MAKTTGKQTYTIQGVKVWQGELTIGQDIKLAEIFSTMDGDKMNDIQGLITEVTKEGNITDLFRVVLKGPIDEIDIMEIPNSVFEKIVSDFLVLNDGLLMKLKAISPVVKKSTK